MQRVERALPWSPVLVLTGGLSVLGLSAIAMSAGAQAGVGLAQMTAGIATTPGTQQNADAQNLQQALPYTSIFGVTYGVVRGAVTALNGGNVAQAVNTGVLLGYKIQSILTGATAATDLFDPKTYVQTIDAASNIYEGGSALWTVLFGQSDQPAQTAPAVAPQPDQTTDSAVACDSEGCYSTDESITYGQYDGPGELGATMDGG